MSPLGSLAASTRWFGENLAFNLGFIPAEKLNWQPAPTAKSALQIVAHQIVGMNAMKTALSGGGIAGFSASPPQFDSLEAAQNAIRQTTRDYADFLESLSPADSEGVVELPFGAFPRAVAAAMEAQDLIHHHGQIAYIQTLLGDTEDHFLPLG